MNRQTIMREKEESNIPLAEGFINPWEDIVLFAVAVHPSDWLRFILVIANKIKYSSYKIYKTNIYIVD